MNIKPVLMFAASFIGGPALAQSTDASEPSPVASETVPSQGDGVADIIVTAQRRSERLQDVPIAVSAVTAAALDRTGVRDIVDIKFAVPTLNLVSNNGWLSTSLRGIGSNAIGAGIENPVAIYIDGVYLGSQAGSLMSLNNVRQVEVLKGPQGTLFGRNSTGGLIQIYTSTPTSRPSASFNLSYGNYDTVVANAYVSGGLGETLAADLALQYTHQGEGWGRNRTTGQDVSRIDHDFAARSKWVFTPTDLTTFTLIGDYVSNRNSMNAVRTFPGTINGFLPRRGPEPDYGYDVVSNVEPRIETEGGGGSLRWEQRIGALSFTSTTAYRRSRSDIQFDYDTRPDLPGDLIITQSDKQFSQELQLSSPSQGRLTWVAGAYFYDATSGYVPFAGNFPDTGVNLRVFGKQDTRSLAGYAQATYEIIDNTRLTLGGRYTNEKRKLYDQATDIFVIPIGVQLPTTVYPARSATFNKFTYRASLDHRFSDEVLAYVSLNRGFKSGGFNVGAPLTAAFRPETLDAYEVGLKTDILDKRLRVNVAGFYYDYKDIQVNQLIFGSAAIVNGAEATIYGLDLDLILQVSRAFSVTGGLGWTSPKFGEFPDCPISPRGGGVPIVSGSCKGNLLPLASKFTGSIGANYMIETSSGKFDVNGNIYYNSGFFPEPDNAIFQRRYLIAGASVKYTMNDGLSIGAFGRNLTNQRVISFSSTEANGTQQGYYQAPRTYGVTVGYKF